MLSLPVDAEKLHFPRRNQFHAPLPRISAQGMTDA